MNPNVPAETVCDGSNPGACNPCIDTKVPCTCNDGGSCEINYLSRGTVCDAADAGIILGVCDIGKCGGDGKCTAANLEQGTACFTDNDVQCDNAGTCDGSGVCTSIGCPVEPPVDTCRFVGQPCKKVDDAVGICCVDPSSSTIILQCVDAPCPCGTCTRKSGNDSYGTNTAYCTNDAAASVSCDNSCGYCSSGNGIGLNAPKPPSFTGSACNDANSCKEFIPDLPKGVNPNSLCPQSQICVACKAAQNSQDQGCCLASPPGSTVPTVPCP